jgi:hypothetical protein
MFQAKPLVSDKMDIWCYVYFLHMKCSLWASEINFINIHKYTHMKHVIVTGCAFSNLAKYFMKCV